MLAIWVVVPLEIIEAVAVDEVFWYIAELLLLDGSTKPDEAAADVVSAEVEFW